MSWGCRSTCLTMGIEGTPCFALLVHSFCLIFQKPTRVFSLLPLDSLPHPTRGQRATLGTSFRHCPGTCPAPEAEAGSCPPLGCAISAHCTRPPHLQSADGSYRKETKPHSQPDPREPIATELAEMTETRCSLLSLTDRL